MAWLDSINKEGEQRGARRLESCLLSAHGDVFKVPWPDLVYPPFPSEPSLKKENESSVKDGDMLMKTSQLLVRDVSSSRAASEDTEDSEGEYVELMELPRFSPQKGSLTQSINLQHRARTSTHATHTLSSWPGVEVSSHTPLCSRLMEENLIQDPCGTVILTAISSTSSAPPEALGPISWTSLENMEGTDSGIRLKLNTEPESCTDVSEEEEEEEPGGGMEERELMKRQKGKHGMVVPDDEDKEEKQLEDAKYRQDEGLLNESEDTEGELDELEEIEVEEEVQVTVQQQNRGRREEEQIMKEGEEEEETQENTHSVDSYSECNRQPKHSYNSYCEDKTNQRHPDNPSENKVVQTLFEDSYSENHNQHRHNGDSYSENHNQHRHHGDSYSENHNQHRHHGDSYSENHNQHRHHGDSYSENHNQHRHHGDSYSENHNQHRHHGDFYSAKHKPSEDSCSETNSPPMDAESLWCRAGQENQREKKKEEEEQSEEVGGGRTAKPQTEGLSRRPFQSYGPPSTGPSPTEPEPQLHQSAASMVPVRLSQSSQASFYTVLLRSGALCLPGTRDRSGRVLLAVCTTNSVWSNPDCDSAVLLRLLLYYCSTLRKEVAALGLTVLVDARGAAPVPVLFSALRALQENVPGSVHSVLLLLNKDSFMGLDVHGAAQVEVLFSLKSLQKHVALQQFPAEFGGSSSFSLSSWLCFRSRLEQLTIQCDDVIKLLQKTVNILQNTPLPAGAEEAEVLLSRYQTMMRSVLEDSRLVQLQQEGGASLSRLRREEGGVGVALEVVSALYEQVDELLHRLVTLSNARTQELNFILYFKGLETGFAEVSSWLQDVGEAALKTLNEADDSLELLNKKQGDFREFHTAAYDRCRQGEELLSRLDPWGHMTSADLRVYEVKVHSFWAQLQDFSQRVNTTGQNLERSLELYSFLDQASGWASEGMRHLAAVSMEDCTLPDKCQSVIGCLEELRLQHPLIPEQRFQEMRAAARELRGERGLRQWSFAWSKCQETKKMFDRKMEAALRTRDLAQRQWDSAPRRRSDSTHSRGSVSSRRKLSGLWGVHQTSSCPSKEDKNSSSSAPPQHTPLLQRLFHSLSTQESADQATLPSSGPSLRRHSSSFSSSSFFSSGRRQQLRKSQSFDYPPAPEAPPIGPCTRALSEPRRSGNTGVFIRGLEVSSSEAANRTLCPRAAGPAPRSPGTPGTTRGPETDPRPRGSKLRHVVEEMVTTEREYVRSLRYIIHHYFPEMDRSDLPQDLRGKRSVVFGNLEKLLDFHSQFFLRELEACWRHPLRVPHCFIRHKDQFSLYALYSKNKPKSDALLAHHGNSFFRRKQVELGDKMDLSSYLLKPVQRMSKYALLLTDLIKEVGVAQEAELATLHAATNMVKFHLRHGNDLLAMDAIRDCDVNLKEQGQLIRQDEFTVWTGRRKCQRHIFLFEELVLFSKPKKMEGGLDVFIYKHSFKTADVGLTESAGDDGLRFEIWFRRRTSRNQTFILQATTSEVKHAWTTGIARILWTQATRNKEIRLKEMVSMGVGNKPFLDIQPSDAAISDRAVHYIMKSRGARTRASIAVSVFDHSNPFNGGVVTSDLSASGASSSGLLGPLNLHMYSQNLSPSPAAEGSFITSCVEEEEQETSSQPSMTTESSGSSSRCRSGSTGSDSGCVSSHMPEEQSHAPNLPSNSQKAVLGISPSTIV